MALREARFTLVPKLHVGIPLSTKLYKRISTRWDGAFGEAAQSAAKRGQASILDNL